MLSLKIDMRALTKIMEIPKKIINAHGLMNDIGQYMVSSTQRKINSGIEPINAPLTRAWKKGGGLTLRDTNKLASSIAHKADSQQVIIGTNAVQGRIQQLGGTVKPKSAKKLYIPAGWKTRQVMRKFGMTPGKCIEGMKNAGYSIWRSKTGKALMAALKGAKGKKGEAFVLFVLKDSIEIPARRYLDIDTADKEIITEKTRNWILKEA
ncbi:MAG: phage virion morphogenesis protein [Nitrospirae bacterium]|nr:phage virion morphogenesis protein [Nitrospirota bacterium]